MNQPLAANPAPVKARPNTGTISGRLDMIKRRTGQNGTLWIHLVKLPQVDEFTNGGTVELTGNSKLGAVGELITVQVRLTGYPRSYKGKPDPETGEVELVRTADNRYVVVEQ